MILHFNFSPLVGALTRDPTIGRGDHAMSDAMRQVAVLRAACCVAGVDGHTSAAEHRIVKRLAAEAGVGAASLEAMIERAETDKEFYSEQFRVLKADQKETMQLLFRVAVADVDLHQDEAFVLQRLSQRLEVSPAQYDKWMKQTISFLKKKTARRES